MKSGVGRVVHPPQRNVVVVVVVVVVVFVVVVVVVVVVALDARCPDAPPQYPILRVT